MADLHFSPELNWTGIWRDGEGAVFFASEQVTSPHPASDDFRLVTGQVLQVGWWVGNLSLPDCILIGE